MLCMILSSRYEMIKSTILYMVTVIAVQLICCHFSYLILGNMLVFLGENVAQKWAWTIQGGGWDVENSSASKYSSFLWFLRNEPIKRQASCRIGYRTDDFGNLENVSSCKLFHFHCFIVRPFTQQLAVAFWNGTRFVHERWSLIHFGKRSSYDL